MSNDIVEMPYSLEDMAFREKHKYPRTIPQLVFTDLKTELESRLTANNLSLSIVFSDIPDESLNEDLLAIYWDTLEELNENNVIQDLYKFIIVCRMDTIEDGLDTSSVDFVENKRLKTYNIFGAIRDALMDEKSYTVEQIISGTTYYRSYQGFQVQSDSLEFIEDANGRWVIVFGLELKAEKYDQKVYYDNNLIL